MTRYTVERHIAASPSTIWSLLTDASSYEKWNEAVLEIEGPIALGETVRVRSVVNPKRTFSVEVSEFDAPSTMVWSDGMPLGLFKGVRTYTIRPAPDGGSTFAMEEVFSGLLEPLISRSIPDMSESFEQFADGLKRAAEGG